MPATAVSSVDLESDLIRLRTREGMAVARAKGHLPKLSARQEAHLAELFASGQHSTKELAELFGVTRSTVYRGVARDAHQHPAALTVV
jgi:DNA invertase Pin-like site-specific DNA recombinase